MFYQNFKFHDPRGRESFATAWPYYKDALFLYRLSSLLPDIVNEFGSRIEMLSVVSQSSYLANQLQRLNQCTMNRPIR